MTGQTTLFAGAAAKFSSQLRNLSFKSILRKDSKLHQLVTLIVYLHDL